MAPAAALLWISIAGCILGIAGAGVELAPREDADRRIWVVESEIYAENLRSVLLNSSQSWEVRWCGANGSLCSVPDDRVCAVVGMADAVNLSALVNLKLVQSASNYYTPVSEVPPQAIIARYNPDYIEYGVNVIAEWLIAAALSRIYKLPTRSNEFRKCAFASNSPYGCTAASTYTSHRTFSSLTVGILGYGHIGRAVAKMAAGLGATVVASDPHGPFEPPPPPLAWLSPSNERLFRAADVLFVTVAGRAGIVVNATGLRLLPDDAHIIPTAHETVDWVALLAELRRRPSLFASIDNWPAGCWGWPVALCGEAGPQSYPANLEFSKLPNLSATGDMSMRDAVFWSKSVGVVASNLLALAKGTALAYVVRNATAVEGTRSVPSTDR